MTERRRPTVNTIEYVNAHGCAPRGRACWAFDLRGALDTNDTSVFYSRPMQSYATAVEDARRMAALAGATEIVVRP